MVALSYLNIQRLFPAVKFSPVNSLKILIIVLVKIDFSALSAPLPRRSISEGGPATP
jgi:hypothetical protein